MMSDGPTWPRIWPKPADASVAWKRRNFRGDMDRSFAVPAPVSRSARAPQWVIWAALACGIGLGGCVEENTAQAPVAAAPDSDNIARRPDVSPAGATVAVASISGAPGGLDDKYQAMLASYAQRG